MTVFVAEGYFRDEALSQFHSQVPGLPASGPVALAVAQASLDAFALFTAQLKLGLYSLRSGWRLALPCVSPLAVAHGQRLLPTTSPRTSRPPPGVAGRGPGLKAGTFAELLTPGGCGPLGLGSLLLKFISVGCSRPANGRPLIAALCSSAPRGADALPAGLQAGLIPRTLRREMDANSSVAAGRALWPRPAPGRVLKHPALPTSPLGSHPCASALCSAARWAACAFTTA